jgi:hypothetical protein
MITQWNKWATFNIVMTSHLVFMSKGTVLVKHLSYINK